ncbi:MAG: nuclear transport factor 2 family protein [Spirosomataceae bacterium]
MKEQEEIIRHYLDGYNQFDISKMVADLDEHIVFRNSSNGEITLELQGLEAFRQQAEQATAYFLSRTQTITALVCQENRVEVQINYHAVLAIDLPNGLKKGDELSLQGISIFEFAGNKICKLTDIS